MDAVLTSPGSYVVAVSGGVDSMVLLSLLQAKPDLRLVVAHFDHGIRNDSTEDRKFVQAFAKDNGLEFVYEEGRLGVDASEAKARNARYKFLRKVLKDEGAAAIVTAHHQDDVLETTIINLLRGSGRKGLTSLGNRPGIERPLLSVPKCDLIAYAKSQGLRWREDPTNQDLNYLRNYVRHRLLPQFDKSARTQLLDIITSTRETNREIDRLLLDQLDLQSKEKELDRYWFTQLPHAMAKETMAAWLRVHDLRDFDSKTLERLVVAAKVSAPGKTFDVLKGNRLAVGTERLALA